MALAASDQHIEKHNNSTTTQRNQRNQSHVKPNTSQASNNQQQNLNRPHLSPYLSQQQQQQKAKHKQKQHQPLLQLKLQCKYKLTEVSDVTFNELLARQVVSQAADSAETSLESESESGKLLVSSSDGRKKSKLVSQQISREFQNGDDEWLAAARTSGRRRRRWIQDGNSKAAQDLFTISKSTDNQVTQSKCPASQGELLQALASSPLARSSDICRVGVSPLILDDPLIVELNEIKSNIGENPLVESSSNSIMGLSEVTLAELEAESETDTNKRISHEEDYESKGRLARKVEFISAKRADNSNQVPSQNVVSNGENINLLKSNHNTLRVNCLTLGALLGEADEILASSSSAGSFCKNAFDRRRALISGKYQLYNHALGLNENSLSSSSSPANSNRLRPFSHRLGTSNSYNNNNNNNGSSNKQADLLSYLSLEGLTSGDTFGNATKQEQQAATELQEKISNYYNGDEHNLGANWPIIVADSSASNELSSIGGETQRWQLLAPPLLEWFINNQEVSLMLSC